MSFEFPITKAHLEVRRGRRPKFGFGMKRLDVPISAAAFVALEMLSAYDRSARPPRTNRLSSEAVDYAGEALERWVAERFRLVFGKSFDDFSRGAV